MTNTFSMHLLQCVRQQRMPVAVSPIDGKVQTVLREFFFERRDQFADLLVDGTLAIEVIIMLRDRQQTLVRNIPSAQHIFEKGNDVIAGFRAACGSWKMI